MNNFQSESKKIGFKFEQLVENHLLESNKTVLYRGFKFKELGIDVDFVADDGEKLEYIEAKGGETGLKKRPGAQRTDSVKKAIANAALLKSVKPDAYFVIYFSAEPKKGNSADKMIETALRCGYVDEVRYITPPLDNP